MSKPTVQRDGTVLLPTPWIVLAAHVLSDADVPSKLGAAEALARKVVAENEAER